jgi:MFS transporter, DHA3 family, macrolide efflux protein
VRPFDRDFRVFVSTQGISNVGDAAWGVLIPLYVLQLTHNPLQVSAIAAVEVGANCLLQVPLGALADRREGRRLMIIADLGRALLTLAVPVTSLLHGPTLLAVYLIAVPNEALSALFGAASGGVIWVLVPQEQQAGAYAWQEGLESVAWVIGPPLAGLLATLAGAGPALALDSGSFLVSVAGLAAVRRRFEPSADEAPVPLLGSMTAGVRLLAANLVLRRNQLIWSAYGVLGGGIVLGLVYVGSRGGRSDVLATVTVAAYAAGSAVGTFAAGKFSQLAPHPWLAAAAGLLTASAGGWLLAADATATVIAGAVLFGLGEGFLLIVYLTVRAAATPEGYFGRVSALAGVFSQLTTGLSMAWIGLALRFAHGPAMFAAMGGGLLAICLWVAVAPHPSVAGHAGPREGDRRA